MNTELWEPSPVIGPRNIPNTPMPMHPRAAETGGIIAKDENDTMRATVKKMVSGIAEKALKGELQDMFKMSMPADMHAPYSYI